MRCALVVVVVAGCSFHPGIATSDAANDAPSFDAMPDAALSWGTPTLVGLPGALGALGDDDPTLTDDLLELYVNSNNDVHVSRRLATDQVWPMPVIVPLVSSAIATETTPEVGYDGLAMIVASDRLGTIGGLDLWLSTRLARTDPWSDPQRIDDLASPTNEAGGNMTPDGLAIVFSSFRKSNLSPDLFYAERAGATWNVVEIDAVNTNGHEGSPFLSADKLTLYFDTDRDGSVDLYTSQRTSTAVPFPAPTKIPDINTNDVEADPWLSLDGRRLVFVSDRGGVTRLWQVTR